MTVHRWAVAMDEFEVVCEFCEVAVVKVPEIFKDECVEPKSVYS